MFTYLNDHILLDILSYYDFTTLKQSIDNLYPHLKNFHSWWKHQIDLEFDTTEEQSIDLLSKNYDMYEIWVILNSKISIFCNIIYNQYGNDINNPYIKLTREGIYYNDPDYNYNKYHDIIHEIHRHISNDLNKLPYILLYHINIEHGICTITLYIDPHSNIDIYDEIMDKVAVDPFYIYEPYLIDDNLIDHETFELQAI
jgi:hypothetical protein